MANAVSGRDVQRVLDEANASVKAAPAAAAVIPDIPDFCGIYRRDVRPLLVTAIAVLRFVNPSWADALAKAVAFIDTVCK